MYIYIIHTHTHTHIYIYIYICIYYIGINTTLSSHSTEDVEEAESIPPPPLQGA